MVLIEQVFYSLPTAVFVNEEKLRGKGSDASNAHDEEVQSDVSLVFLA